MKLLLTVFFLVFFLVNYGQQPDSPAAVKEWVEAHFSKGKIPPFSFVYGGSHSDKFIRNWEFSTEKLPSEEPSVEKTVYTWSERGNGLAVRCLVNQYHDFPVVEWVLHFSNRSGRNSQTITKAAALDHSFVSENTGDFILHHSKGSDHDRSDFLPMDEVLQPGQSEYLTPAGGRSSDKTSFPFFNLELPGNQGIVTAIGWTGKWYADVIRGNDNSVNVKSGMENMALKLFPGEEIRTPRICLLFWKSDDRMAGHNQFRRFILAHHSRKINGCFAEYPLSGSFDYGDPAPCHEYICLREEYAIALVKRYEQFGILPELFWLDAGWYTGCGWNKEKGGWWQNVGNWTVDQERFPNGLKAVADAVHEAGAKFMVWFEPERVMPGTQLDVEHPEWLIQLPGRDDRLFDLGNAGACKWLTHYISEFIQKEGIDYYRQDFNFDPMPYWIANDKPGREGISEIRHIEGLYAFWDSLLVRFPNLLIDNCASGGRRIDLETTSRSAPLWRTDYDYGEPNGYQSHTFGLHYYLPVHGTAIYQTDSYTFRSGLGATAVANWEVTGKNSEPIPAIQKRIQDFKNLRPFFYGDYYPLTRAGTRNSDWIAFQFNRPEENDGIVLAFRRPECRSENIIVKLGGIDKNSDYELFFEDYNLRIVKSGNDLVNGLEFSIPHQPSSLLVRYQKQHK
ncbi:MAG: alpha-galactosidase [Mangrovibacterium sp.]|nr:alpha-galactosidase [Mangrovibacterium sp.]